jgi:AraC-like DNA-binding protein
MDIQINTIKLFIEDNLKNEFSLTDIANHAGYSAYHLSREYKKETGHSIMDYVRERKICEAAKDIADGDSILETALIYGFGTHAGFTRAFLEVIGCSPMAYYQHYQKLKSKGETIMDKSKLKVRLVCETDVNALWENVYSAMTPKQITEDKILPSIKNYKDGNGFLAIAELNGNAVMTMWVERLYSSPGFIYDCQYNLRNDDYDQIFFGLLDGAKRFAKQINIGTLCMYTGIDSAYVESFVKGGFEKVFTANGFVYTMFEV